jgi:hypothetical protein
MRTMRLSGLAAIMLLCSLTAAGAETRAPGSTEPVTAPPASQGAPQATPQATAKPAKEAKPASTPRRRVRHAQRCWYRPFYLMPPPQYWFRPWPQYRCYRPRPRR